MIKNCIECGKDIIVYPSTKKRTKYCSVKCKAISQQGKPTWNKGKKTGLVPRTAFKIGHIPATKGKKLPHRSGRLPNP